MAESLRAKGQLSPIVAASEEDRFVLVDGFVRVLAAKRLCVEHLMVELVDVTPAQMKAQIYVRNRERGLHLVEECRLVRELVEVDSLTQTEAADLLERHKSWVCRRLALARRLSTNLLAEAELGRLNPGSLSKLALLPKRNQEEVWAVGTELDSGEVGLLAELWRKAPDPDARAWVLANPRAAIATAKGKSDDAADPRLGPIGDEVMKCLVALRRVSLRLTKHVRQLGVVTSEGVDVLARAHRLAHAESTDALKRLNAVLETDDG